MSFSLEKFEYLAYSRQFEPAAKELVALLSLLDSQYGQLGSQFQAKPLSAVGGAEVDSHLLTRMAGATSALFADPAFTISDAGFQLLMPYHRWISTVFAASPYRNADHVIRSMNMDGADPANFRVEPQNYYKFCLLYSPESELAIDLDALWAYNPGIAASLFLTLMSPRFLGTPMAHSKRELLLKWLPPKLKELPTIDGLPIAILHDVYMHCSYADLAEKHDIKRSINVLIERKLISVGLNGLTEAELTANRAHRDSSGKPVMLVLMEWFTGGHSIYRTHSRTLEGARERFHVIGMGFERSVDELGRAVFDEFVALDKADDMFANLRQITELAKAQKPAIFYMPSVGMFPITMFMSNLRVAPIQVAALGHPATTHSDKIDYISVEEDFVGSPDCFSEKLLKLPRDGQPYRPSASLQSFGVPDKPVDHTPLRVAVAATTMKLNPKFLTACVAIQSKAKTPFEFHFLVGQAQGLVYPQVSGLIKRYLPNAVVHGHQPYLDYMADMASCSLFLSPFPFGNTNGIVDAVTIGLPGVNLTGPEVLQHIDEALFSRLGLPEWLTAKSTDDYVSAAVRLIDETDTRTQIRTKLLSTNAVEHLFKGDAQSFGKLCLELI